MNVADLAAFAAWAKEALASDGPLDLLVNNAALLKELGTLWEVPPEEFSRE